MQVEAQGVKTLNYLVKGVVAPYSPFGLEEISQESTTHDGRLKGFDPAQPARAADGLRVGDSQQLTAAYRAGVLTAVAVPKAEGVVKGLSVGFAVGAESEYCRIASLILICVELIVLCRLCGRRYKRCDGSPCCHWG